MNCEGHLKPLLTLDLRLPRKIAQAWHALLLTLLAIPNFKANLAPAYCETYNIVTREYASGVGVLDSSLFTLSVQLLNRKTYVRELASQRFLLERLVESLYNMLNMAKIINKGGTVLQQFSTIITSTTMTPQQQEQQQQTHVLNPLHPVLSNRRYSPCISDLKCVLNVTGMARVFACSESKKCLKQWIRVLALAQGIDLQMWRSWSTC